ncbi:zinc finger MYM-type protein 1-like [Helianthus annuus]|uniref:zinc finger MYM-type protein 1-like n=1 Tax=Helianthus annuus TaxID=4232 RepID=UPI000B8FA6F3|nr:zinc finger MYM-type protein 1-like [Helianthus annuus]
MGKPKTIDSFFKRKSNANEEESSKRQKETGPDTGPDTGPETGPSQVEEASNQQELVFSESPLPQTSNDVEPSKLERDPAKRKQLLDYPVNLREQVRLAYLNLGAYQIRLTNYPSKGSAKHKRKFQFAWFGVFPGWLEYSPTEHKCYCFYCFLFNDKSSLNNGQDAFTVKGFDCWNRVNGKHCAFRQHVASNHHKNVVAFTENLLNQKQHIEEKILKFNDDEIMNNRLRLKASIDVVRWLTYQACALRGHNESSSSKNQGNFLELLQLLATYNDDLAKVILENAPYNAKYVSGDIQKQILSILANKIRRYIRSEVGDGYFCVMVDESRDESKRSKWL